MRFHPAIKRFTKPANFWLYRLRWSSGQAIFFYFSSSFWHLPEKKRVHSLSIEVMSCHCFKGSFWPWTKSSFRGLKIRYIFWFTSAFVNELATVYGLQIYLLRQVPRCSQLLHQRTKVPSLSFPRTFRIPILMMTTSTVIVELKPVKPQSVSSCHQRTEWYVVGENSVEFSLSVHKLWPPAHISSSVNSNNL